MTGVMKLIAMLTVCCGIIAAHDCIGMIAVPEKTVSVAVTAMPNGPTRTMRWKAEAAVAEYGYEEEGLVVTERQGEWLRVKLKVGSAWMRVPAGGKFLELGDLLVDTLTYLNKEWDGRLSKAAGGVAGAKLKTETEPTVKVVGKQMVDGKLWVNLEVFDASPCEVPESKVIARGWAPARVVWFYSRGC